MQAHVEHGDSHVIIGPADASCSPTSLARKPAEVSSFTTLLAKVRAQEWRTATSAGEPDAKKVKTE